MAANTAEREQNVTKYSYKLRLISPAFIAGVDKRQPEMRATSIRGQLRYWLRAAVGAKNANSRDLWERESAVFGSTSVGSAISMRVYRAEPAKSAEYAMLPHRRNEGRRRSSEQFALKHGQAFDLTLLTRPGVRMPEDALDALKLWSLLGGIGRRSRRMFGAVEITSPSNAPDWYTPLQSPQELAQLIQEVVTKVAPFPALGAIPSFPTLNVGHSWIIVGQDAYPTYEDALISLFRDLLRSPKFIEKQDTFGQAIGGRRASPLIAQVRRIGPDSYYPVLTALRSKPDRRIDWDHLKLFMLAAESHFNAVRVWGGW